MKCAAFLVADLLGCQSLNYNKPERVSENQSAEIEISGAQGMSFLGDCAYFAGDVAQIMLPFSLYRLSFHYCNKNMGTLEMAGCCRTLSHGYTIVGHVSKGCLKK